MPAEHVIAIHALVYLHHRHGVVSSAELADNMCTNPARVRKVMAKLKDAGLVKSCRGRGAGYCLAAPEDDIALDRVFEAVAEVPVPTGWLSGDPHRECLVSSGMADALREVYADLNECCARRLGAITIRSIGEGIARRR